MVQHGKIELAPDQFDEPCFGALVAVALGIVRGAGERADRHRAVPQMHAQIARAFHRGEIARAVVIGHAVAEIVEELHTRRSCPRATRARASALKPSAASDGIACFTSDGGFASARKMILRRIRLQRIRRERREPVALVRREDGVRLAGACQHVVMIEDGLIPEREKRDVRARQLLRDGLVARLRATARNRGWRTPRSTPHSRASAGISCKRHAVPHDQRAARVAQACDRVRRRSHG